VALEAIACKVAGPDFIAISSEADTGSREENASKQEAAV
jgi:hypothetical protein